MWDRPRLFAVSLAIMCGLSLFAVDACADVRGSLGTHVSMHPQSNATEFSLVDFDIENDLNLTVVISGLSTSLHSHFGIAGIEDVILTSIATLGSLDMEAVLVFGRFPFGSIFPFYSAPPLHFIKKIIRSTITVGGFTLTNVAQFEDTNAFIVQTAAYALGDVISITGATPSGIEITLTTGICMQKLINRIKKHAMLSPYSVNPDCATDPKPDILFDFEEIQISGVPIAPSLTGSAIISCITITQCQFVTTFSVLGGPVPISASLIFTDLLSLSFGGGTITLSFGTGQVVINILPTASLGLVSFTMRTPLLNPGNTNANLGLNATIAPGIGLTSALVILDIFSGSFLFTVDASFSGGPPAQFSNITFSLVVPGSLLELETVLKFNKLGMINGDLSLTVNF